MPKNCYATNIDFFNELSNISNYVIIDDKTEFLILVDNFKSVKKRYKIHNNKLIISIDDLVTTIFIFSTKNSLLDKNWCKLLFKNSIIYNGKRYVSLNDKKYVILYFGLFCTNFFKYSSKININNKFFNKYNTAEELLEILKSYMNNNDFHPCYVNGNNIFYQNKIKGKIREKKLFIRVCNNLNTYKNKIPGVISKIYFLVLKPYNRLCFIRKISSFKKCYKEINKYKTTYGCLYYILIDNEKNKKYFLKAMDYFKTYKNEIKALSLLGKNSEFYPKIHNFDKNSYVSVEYLDGVTFDQYLNFYSLNKSDYNKLFSFFETVLDEMYVNNIIHRDIRPQNIMVKISKNNHIESLKLFDFGYAVFNLKDTLNIDNLFDRRILKSLGDYYKPELYCWDDAVSIINILEEIDKDIFINYEKEIIKIKNKIGRLTYKIESGGKYEKNSFFNSPL